MDADHKDPLSTKGVPTPTELQRRLAEVEKIVDPHKRRTARAKVMARVGRWVVKNSPAQARYDADGYKKPQR